MNSSWATANASTSHVGEDGLCRVRDYGRGIPLGKVVECVSVINTGAKYNTEVFQFSVGLNGVGTKAVNALSAQLHGHRLSRRPFQDRGCLPEACSRRRAKAKPERKTAPWSNFSRITDSFPVYQYDPQYVEQRLWRYAYLNAGLSLYLDGDAVPLEKRPARPA